MDIYEGVSKRFRTGRLERELQMVQLSATSCSCIAILWVSLVNFAAITLCVTSQWVFIVVVCFIIDSVRKLLDTPSYNKYIYICIFLWTNFLLSYSYRPTAPLNIVLLYHECIFSLTNVPYYLPMSRHIEIAWCIKQGVMGRRRKAPRILDINRRMRWVWLEAAADFTLLGWFIN
jgi:hypothetical protein